jgi:hypothetical protein
MSVLGGRPPYALTSSEPAVFPVPAILDGHSFTVIPNNPGVIDADLKDTDVPRRSVTLSARDVQGNTVFAKIAVIRNFLIGYNISFTSTTCPQANSACAGGETVVRVAPIVNGNLVGDKLLRLEIVRSECRFVDPLSGETQLPSILVRSDHFGVATAVMRCPAGIASQVGVIRVVDVATGVSADFAFVVTQASASSALKAIPESITFTGKDSTVCGTGTADFLVFDGQAPYFATSTDSNISVTPRSDSNPGRFTVTAFNPNICVEAATIVVTDARGGRTTVTVKTEKGAGTPPTPPAMTVAPTDVTVLCGQSASVAVVGGSGNYFTTSTHPRVTSVVSGNTVTITRLTGDGAVAYPVDGTVAISDGATIKTVDVTTVANCP